MKPLLYAAGLVALAACAAPASTPAVAAAATEPRACFFSNRITNFRAADDRTVYLKVGIKDVYRLDLLGACPDVDWGWSLGVRSQSSTICTGLDVDLMVPTPIGPQRCPVKRLHKLTAAELEALPKGDRP